MLINDILKVSMRIKNLKDIFSSGTSTINGRALRFKWDWLVNRTIGSSYIALTSGNSLWHNSALGVLDYRNAYGTDDIKTNVHISQDYVYIVLLQAPKSDYEVCLNCEVTMHVQKV